MFGPNTHFKDSVDIAYSHRDKCFFELFDKTRELFSEKFHLQDYDVLFIPGSGTVGIESLFFSSKCKIKMIGNDGTFKQRWSDMSKVYDHDGETLEMFCLLETSCSAPFAKEGCIVDAISGFPYYDIPENTIAFATCLNKQLGSYVGLSVVCVRKDCWHYFMSEEKMSYLNLIRYKKYHAIGQAPSTSPTYIYEHLYKCLQTFDLLSFRQRLNAVSDMLVEAIGSENIIGSYRGPVITLKPNVIPEKLVIKYDLYGYWTGKPNLQIFTYTEPIEQYEIFVNELKQAKGNS